MLCPHCDHEISEDSIESLEGICPMCEGPLSKSSSMWDDAGDYDREYAEDDFEDEFDEELDKEIGGSGDDDYEEVLEGEELLEGDEDGDIEGNEEDF